MQCDEFKGSRDAAPLSIYSHPRAQKHHDHHHMHRQHHRHAHLEMCLPHFLRGQFISTHSLFFPLTQIPAAADTNGRRVCYLPSMDLTSS